MAKISNASAQNWLSANLPNAVNIGLLGILLTAAGCSKRDLAANGADDNQNQPGSEPPPAAQVEENKLVQEDPAPLSSSNWTPPDSKTGQRSGIRINSSAKGAQAAVSAADQPRNDSVVWDTGLDQPKSDSQPRSDGSPVQAATVEMQRFYDNFPTEIPGIGRVDKYPTPGFNAVVIEFRNFHTSTLTGLPLVATALSQQQIWQAANYIRQLYGINSFGHESATLEYLQDLARLRDDPFGTAEFRRDAEDPDLTPEAREIFAGLAKNLDQLGQPAWQETLTNRFLSSAIEYGFLTGSNGLYTIEDPQLTAAVQPLIDQAQKAYAAGDSTRAFDWLGRAVTPEILEAREDAILNNLAAYMLKGELPPVAAIDMGAGHRFENNIALRNAANRDGAKFASIVITPQVVNEVDELLQSLADQIKALQTIQAKLEYIIKEINKHFQQQMPAAFQIEAAHEHSSLEANLAELHNKTVAAQQLFAQQLTEIEKNSKERLAAAQQRRASQDAANLQGHKNLQIAATFTAGAAAAAIGVALFAVFYIPRPKSNEAENPSALDEPPARGK